MDSVAMMLIACLSGLKEVFSVSQTCTIGSALKVFRIQVHLLAFKFLVQWAFGGVWMLPS